MNDDLNNLLNDLINEKTTDIEEVEKIVEKENDILKNNTEEDSVDKESYDYFNNLMPKNEEKTFHTGAEYDKIMKEFAHKYVEYEAEIKEVKNNFKEIKKNYAEMGIPVAATMKMIKQTAKYNKASPYDIKNEEQILNIISKDADLLNKIKNIF